MVNVATPLRAKVTRRSPGLVVVSTSLLLVITALLPFVSDHADGAGVVALAVLGVFAATVALPGVTGRLLPDTADVRRTWWRSSIGMALYLSPVILLTAVFPFATERIVDTRVGDIPLTSLLLASSVTVPWLSQAVCLPMYRAIGPLIADGNMDAIQRRFCQVWPAVFAQSLPTIALFAVPVQLVLSWRWEAFGTYLILCVLHVAFAQSLIVSNVGRLRLRWAVAWTCYATALFILPAAWYLPPIVGLASQLIPMRNYLGQMRSFGTIDISDAMRDLFRGLLLGAVLWADKLFLFVRTDGTFAVNAIFIALLPAILAYNYYFVQLAPHIDRSVGDVRSAMETEPSQVMSDRSEVVSDVVVTSIIRTAFVGSVIAMAVTVAVALFAPDMLAMVTAVAIASLLFMMTTLATYKLDYIGYQFRAQAYGAVHLAFCVALFVVMPIGPQLYVWLAALEAVLFVAALRMCLAQWRSAEYALFWRHATAW